jgi:hypothetical protein
MYSPLALTPSSGGFFDSWMCCCCCCAADLYPCPAAPLARAAGNGVFLLLLLNVVMFVLDHVLHVPGIQGLYLNHLKPQWYQVSTAESQQILQYLHAVVCCGWLAVTHTVTMKPLHACSPMQVFGSIQTNPCIACVDYTQAQQRKS